MRVLSVSSTFLGFNSQVQIVITRQPKVWSSVSACKSRVWVFVIFCRHHSVLVLGSTKYLQPLCPCQKQPFTNITVLYFGRTISGFPGRFFRCKRYRNPLANKNFRIPISGLVSFPLIRDIL